MALHFGISMIAVTATALTVEMLFRDRYFRRRAQSWQPPALFRALMWSSLVVMYGIAYLGAYVRHSDAVIACYTWPDCNGAIIPELSGPVGIHFAHRAAAGFGMVLVWGLLYWAYRFREQRPDVYRVLQVASVIILMQALAGGLVVETALALVSTLLHAALMAALFVTLCIGCRMILPVRETSPATDPAVSRGAMAAPAGD
jgi:cytochrome c oxidase assembly protein subunit 15